MEAKEYFPISHCNCRKGTMDPTSAKTSNSALVNSHSMVNTSVTVHTTAHMGEIQRRLTQSKDNNNTNKSDDDAITNHTNKHIGSRTRMKFRDGGESYNSSSQFPLSPFLFVVVLIACLLPLCNSTEVLSSSSPSQFSSSSGPQQQQQPISATAPFPLSSSSSLSPMAMPTSSDASESSPVSVPLSPPTTTGLPPASAPTRRQITTTPYFVNGLANHVRRINATALLSLTQKEPFKLQFRTVCSFGNLVFDDKFSLTLNSQGILTYNVTGDIAKIYHNVADGNWHSITFDSDIISLDDHELHDPSEVQSPIPLPNINWISWFQGAPTPYISFFDGFVGCVKLPTPPNSATTHSSTGGDVNNNDENSENVEDAVALRMRSISGLFGLSYRFEPCIDGDLSTLYACHNPDDFIQCANCPKNAQCEAVDVDGDDVLDRNRCNCPANDTTVEYYGPYCEKHLLITPPVPVVTPKINLIRESTETHEILSPSPNDTIEPPSPQFVPEPSSIAPVTYANKTHRQFNDYETPTQTINYSSTTSTSTVSPAASPLCPCQNEGECVGGNDTIEQQCNCKEGFRGDFCEYDINECEEIVPKVCTNGYCLNKHGGYDCFCVPGYAGEHCENDIDECLSSPCVNDATCINLLNKYMCNCSAGFAGKNCEININECESDPCLHGTCFDLVANFTCECDAGYEGRECNIDIDECALNVCENGGICEDKVADYFCNCDDTGYTGRNCTINIDDCESQPCQNEGRCTDGVKEHFCECYEGYEGSDCEIDIDECELSPCLNNGTCYQLSNRTLYEQSNWHFVPRQFRKQFDINNAFGRVCSCIAGFEGADCQVNIDECSPQPCLNGKCQDRVNEFFCECNPGYSGRICGEDINECESNPCERGTCKDEIADYQCVCPQGYGGKNCSVALLGCISATCFNSGTCFPTYDVQKEQHNFTCECYPGFTGRGCEQKTTISFNGTGLAISTNHDDNYERGHYELTFRFRTTLPDVQLVLGKGVTYFVLTLIGGKLNLQSSLLNNLKGISSGNNLANADWQRVGITVNNTHIALAANSEQTIHPIQEGEDGTSSGFNTTILGGASTKLGFLNKQGLNFFIGCMQDIRINSKTIVAGLDEPNVNLSMVSTGCVRRDQCKPNPCINGGVCTDMWQSYNCSCPRPYLGKNCEFEYNAATFGHENSTDPTIATVDIPADIGKKFGSTFDISMFVRTREKRGTIFFLGNNSIYLEAMVNNEGQLAVQAKLDDNKEDPYTAGGLLISDGAPHLISIQRDKNWVTIRVNGTEHFRKSVKDGKDFNPLSMYIGGAPEFSTKEQEDSTYEPNIQETPTRSVPTDDITFTKPFKGVIQDVRVNLSSSDIGHQSAHRNYKDQYVVEFFELIIEEQYSKGQNLGAVTLSGRVLEGTVSDNACKVNPCLNEGSVCQVTWNDFECICAQGYDGKICDILLHCAVVSCPEGSVCHNIKWSGFECVSDANFNGKGTFSPHYSLQSNERENLTLQETSFRFRTKEGGNILYISGNNGLFRISLETKLDESTNQTIETVAMYINESKHFAHTKGFLDGLWHSVKVNFGANSDNALGLLYDDQVQSLVSNPDSSAAVPPNFLQDLVLHNSVQIVVGSDIQNGGHRYNIDNYGQSDHQNHLESLHDSFYRGCLSDLKIGDYRLPFVTPTQLLEINSENRSLVETTAPTAFYIDDHFGVPNRHLGCVLCYDDECKNDGTCDNDTEAYECSCNDGFEGALCETNIDECVNNTCEPGSTVSCIDGIANYTCNCKPGYTGWHCDEAINECDPDPCHNGATCEDGEAMFTCHCSQDYIGQRCEKRKRSSCNEFPCEHGACKDIEMRPDGTSFQCDCDLGYEGETCSEEIDFCKDVKCQNGATCSSIKIGYKCHCVPGYDGPLCEQEINECEPIPCLHKGACLDEINAYRCICDRTGYKGINCEIEIDECEHPSLNNCTSSGKLCENLPGSYHCLCPNEYMCGDSCDILDPCYESRNTSCFNDAKCLSFCPSVEERSYACQCRLGFEGDNCERQSQTGDDALDILLIIIPVIAAFLLAATIAIIILVRMARKKRATRGVYSPSQQEYCNPRVELDNVMKPPPEERLI